MYSKLRDLSPQILSYYRRITYSKAAMEPRTSKTGRDIWQTDLVTNTHANNTVEHHVKSQSLPTDRADVLQNQTHATHVQYLDGYVHISIQL